MTSPDKPPTGASFVITAADLPWRSLAEGVEVATVYRDAERDYSMMMLRYQPGATAMRHRHPKGEQYYVVSGTVTDESGCFSAGDFVHHAPGSVHTPSSPDGALVLVTWFGRLEAY